MIGFSFRAKIKVSFYKPQRVLLEQTGNMRGSGEVKDRNIEWGAAPART